MDTPIDTANAKGHPPFTGAWQPESDDARATLTKAMRQVETFEAERLRMPAPDGRKRRRRARSAQIKFETAVRTILCEAMVAVVSEIVDGFRCPRSKGVLEQVDRSRSPALNPLLPQALDALAAVGLITQAIGYVGSGGERIQTVVRPGPALFQLCEPFGLTLDDFRQDRPGDEIILRGPKPEDGGPAPEVRYVDTAQIRQMRAEMQAINAHLAQADIVVTDGGIDSGRRRLRRIFSNGSFESGGRLYGGFWIEGLKSEQRTRWLRIDGKPVVELDFGQCALRILYGMVRAHLPDGDLYAIPGLAHADRDDIKTLLAALTFIGEARLHALAPLTRKLCPDIRPPIDGDLEPMADAVALDRVCHLVRDHHRLIAAFFPSTVGHQVQRIESDIMVRVLLMLSEMGITALPVHDAVLVRHDRADQAAAVMTIAFETLAEAPVVIRRKVREGDHD
jgi:hypothetical protein